MRNVALGFEIHQPRRIRRDAFWNPRKGKPHERYFEDSSDREIFRRIARKCYLPATRVLLDTIEWGEQEGYSVKYFVSISGTFLEQASAWENEVVELLRELSYTHRVEFINQTYYHSVTSLWPDMTEWREQVKMHRDLIRETFDFQTEILENTELIINRRIATEAQQLGFKGMIMEGAERVVKDPNYVYRLKGSDISLIPRNYRLSDDVAFRFSMRNWDQYPLTADKYASCIESTPGEISTIFIDYETFGEHHDASTGILEFLRYLPRAFQSRGIIMRTPREIAKEPFQDLELGDSYVSWADIRKDETSWRGNQMQWAFDESVRKGELLAKDLGGDLLKTWRMFTISDHYYYLYTEGGGPGEVHNYFNHFPNAIDAFINEFYASNDFLSELQRLGGAEGTPFRFMQGGMTYAYAWRREHLEEVKRRNPEVYETNANYIREWLR